jgi:hypothetical protein
MNDMGFFRGVGIVMMVFGALVVLYRLITGHWIGG